jgi:pimeloyl-ACP methyl ester carboxylesterase
MDEREIKKAVLVGHSMGGAISQHIALHHPDRVEKLVLMATGAKLGVSPQLLEALSSNYEMAVSMIKDFGFGPGVPAEVYQPVIDQMRQVGSETAVKDFTACSGFDVRETVSAIQAPALVCCGDKDLLTSPKNNRRLAESLGCKCVELPDAGHMLSIERPMELVEILVGFLSY